MRYMCIFLILLMGCATGRPQFGNGQYQSVAFEDVESENRLDGLSASDAHILISGTMKKLKGCEGIRYRPIMLSNFENQTPESIDMGVLSRQLKDEMVLAGYQFIDKQSRPEMVKEFEWNELGYVDPSKAAIKGKQRGVLYMMRAALGARVQYTDDQKDVRYRFSVQMVELESALIRCVTVVDLKKSYERVRVSL